MSIEPPLDLEDDAELVRPRSRSTLRALLRSRMAVASLAFLLLAAVVAVFAPWLTPAGYAAMRFQPLAAPSWGHLMGTDSLGRDLWSRVAYGTRLSLEVGLVSQAIAALIGISIGAVAAYVGGVAETLLMRVVDVMLTLPSLLIALLFLTLFGNSTRTVTFALGVASWPVVARLMRAQVLQVKQLEYVDAAHSIGASASRVLLRHILPNSWGPIVVQLTFGISQAIVTEAFLSFVGLGSQPPTPSWGRLLVDGFQYVQTSPHLIVFPCIALALTVLAFSFLGDSLSDVLNPQKSR